MKKPEQPSSDSTMKKFRYLFCIVLVACSSSTTVVYQVVGDAGPGVDAGSIDGSIFADEKDGSQEDTGTEDATADATDASFDGAWTDSTFDAWQPDTSFDSSSQ